MNFLILGDGPRERAWAGAIAADVRHRLLATYPDLLAPDAADASPADLEDALALPGLEGVVVGGDFAFRAEALRRAAAEGLAIVVIHPPGPDSEAYYQVALSREETGATVIPDLPTRLHPGLARLADAVRSGELGAFRELRVEGEVEPPSDSPELDLARAAFAVDVDVVRALLGEIEAVNATGDPPCDRPDAGLVVQLRAEGGRRAEVRLVAGVPGPRSIQLLGASGSLRLELPPDLIGPARLVRREGGGGESVDVLPAWNPHRAILEALEGARERVATHPDLLDATRATEVAEGVVRSLRRGRTVELHYEEISEEAAFKGVMTSFGCLILLSILLVIPVALAGPALGMGWTIYLAYGIPPTLLAFLFLQLLRFAARGASPAAQTNEGGRRGSP